MTRKENDRSKQPVLEPRTEPYSHEAFFDKLYSTISEWSTRDLKGQVVAEAEPQEIDMWDLHEGRHPGEFVWLSMKLKKGMLVKTQGNHFALVLGHKLHDRHTRKETLTLQFGFQPESKRFEQLSTIDKLKVLANQPVSEGSYGSGEFYEDSVTGNVQIRSWADRFIFGGENIHMLKQKDLLKGIDACLRIVQRATRNAFREN